MQAGDAFKAGDARLRNHVLAIERAGVQEVKEGSVVIARKLPGDVGCEDMKEAEPNVLRPAAQGIRAKSGIGGGITLIVIDEGVTADDTVLGG